MLNRGYEIVKTDLSSLKEYGEHLKALSDDDKISRFGVKLSDHSIDQLMLSMAYNPQKHILWKVVLLGSNIGWGHLAHDHDDAWELAVSVESEYQGTGVGSDLIRTMISWAKVHNVSEIYMHCIESNKVIQHLAQKHNLKTREREAGERTASLELPSPSFAEMNGQWFSEYCEIIGEINALQKKLSKHMTTPWRK